MMRRIVALSVAAGSAHAAPCGRPDVDATFPPRAADAVPSNALLSARYASPALYDDEPVTLRDESGSEVPLSVSFDEALSVLRATPERALSEGAHQLEWPGLRGVGSGGVGLGRSITFSVSEREDLAAPSFAGLAGIDWDLSRERDPCLDRLEDRFVFRLSVGAATDDAGEELLTLLVFQTRDPTAPQRAEPIQVALQPFPASGSVELRRPATESGVTCFAAVVQDLRGGVSGGGEREVCVTTQSPPFFDGCAVSATRGSRSGSFGFGAVLVLLLRRRGRGESFRLA